MLQKLRWELFKRRTPAQCFIAQEQEIRGGFTFELHFPDCPSIRWIEVKEWEGDRYLLCGFFNTVTNPDGRYTRFAATFAFEQLEREFLQLIGLLLKESAGPGSPAPHVGASRHALRLRNPMPECLPAAGASADNPAAAAGTVRGLPASGCE